ISVDQILSHVQIAAVEPIDDASAQLRAHVAVVCDRLRKALGQASSAAMDARRRLGFESAIVQAGAGLNSVRQLLDLLIRSTERSDTDLYVEEVVHVTFSAPPRANPRMVVKVVVSHARDACAFQASPQVIMPLIAAGIGLVLPSHNDRVYLSA